ncbi:MAG: IS1634 family transposase [Polyangiaceae bacterium]
MYIDIVPNRTSPPAILLRESAREGGRVVKRTIANLSSLTIEQAEAIRLVLKGHKVGPVEHALELHRSRAHGHVELVARMMTRLGFPRLLATKPCRERDLVCAMIAERIVAPRSKLATSTGWLDTTAAELFGVEDASLDELYGALDWLLERQPAIEKKLVRRHLDSGSLVLFDLSSSYYEGRTCPLARRGYSRDGKKGTRQINFGLLTDRDGRPLAVSVFPGNTSDVHTLMPQIERITGDFGLDEITVVGDRGMLTSKHIEALASRQGIHWVGALKSGSIQTLISSDALQLELFDERNLFEFEDDTFPGQRLIACRNPRLAERRARKRQSLLDATCEALQRVEASVESGRLRTAAEIGLAVGKVVNARKVAKHFVLDIAEGHFAFRVDDDAVAAEAALDGIYVVRTDLPAETLSAEDAVRTYKRLTKVERDFRSMKTEDLRVRPIFHRTEERVRAHFALCMLAAYVQWHLKDALKPLTFTDEEQADQPDPVEPARRSESADAKAATRETDDGLPITSFRTLLTHLGTRTRNLCSHPTLGATAPRFAIDSTPTPRQQRALDLVASYKL